MQSFLSEFRSLLFGSPSVDFEMTSEKKVLALSIIAVVFNFVLVVVLILDHNVPRVPRVRLCCHNNDSCNGELKNLSPNFEPIKGKPPCDGMYGEGSDYKIIDVRLPWEFKQLKINFLFYRMD